MKAIVRTQPGPPSVLRLDPSYPKPAPKAGHIIIRVNAIGLNRAELRSRNGDPPAKPEFTSDDLYTETPPAILGEECVGIADDNGGSEVIRKGDTVAAYFCGIGKAFDGAYAEYTRVPARYVFTLSTTLPWGLLGAIPSTFMTAYGSLFRALHIRPHDSVLVHGGTSSVGTAAIMLAKLEGCKVAATTRQKSKVDSLRQIGAKAVLIDGGDESLSKQLKAHETFKDGVDHVLELVGPDRIADAWACAKPFATVCITGVLTKVWALDKWSPAEGIETGKKLTTYQSARDLNSESLGEGMAKLVKDVEDGKIDVKGGIGLTLNGLESIIKGHEEMEADRVTGKIVIVLD
ncbi:MAG: hypothetical protein HETSPECPRED_009898 [Heterodermia speciosa]|uniref:Enoyl reductase (ER) domain-containing protein n=1 Tax=Heterodermia speciosa TaxID=116794 RepID=A0A8H3G375_9LECA|nr:MAG: hypothetical protein HETSPECPRED_009898 [Heterodermia speciosa]